MDKIFSFLNDAFIYLNVLLTVLSASLFSPLKNPPINEKVPQTHRIMSFNVRCTNVGIYGQKQRVGAVVAEINDIAPDSFGVQEATPEWMEDLKANLPAYGVVGVGRDDGENSGEFSAIFYLKNRYDLLDSGTFWLSDTPDVPSRSFGSFLNRVCSWALLKDKETGVEFLHMNTHFDTAKGPREKSVPLILAKAAEHSDIPVVCTGDFNSGEMSSAYLALLSGDLKNAKFEAKDTMSVVTFNNQLHIRRLGPVLDHILVNDKVNSLVYRVVTDKYDGKLPSDHYPIYADLEFIV